MQNASPNIVNIFAQPKASAPAHNKIASLSELPLQVALTPQVKKESSAWLTLLLVLLVHALVVFLISMQKPLDTTQVKPASPMMVSLIAPPSPTHEIVPIIEPPKPQPKPIIMPKKVVEKIKPIEKPTERLVEATTEAPKEHEVALLEAAPVLVAEPAKAPEKIALIVEDKIEPPRFGVSYLNNPAPEYPSLSRRQGEEGRVLMKVLVSVEGKAEDVQIETSSGSDRLDSAAVSAVKRWRFIPAKRNNQPLSAYVLVPMKFTLDS
jgi:periplasmic protein TonB